jgi:ketosteroid isomerase-like protein
MGNQVVVQEKPVREQIREQKRAIERSVRNIEREKRRVETEEKKIKGEIKKMAKAGQHVSNNDIVINKLKFSIFLKLESCKDVSQRHCKNERTN